jgi:NAD(P)-dependent dehydrogenase (short-subunit alcohol dehydrogenase family)
VGAEDQAEESEELRLAEKVSVITGAAQGLGAAIAKRFREEGAFVFVCDSQEEEGRSFAAEINTSSRGPDRAEFLLLDVRLEDSWKRVLGSVKERCGRLDILVNNAGVNIRKDIERMSAEELEMMLAVNIQGPFLGIKHAIPLMRKSGGGCILNMSSICGLIGHRYTNEAYTMTKGAVTLLSRSIAVRYAGENIRCNSVHPSTVDTPLVRAILQDPGRKAERLGEVPLGRLATATDVANAFVFLASDEAAFITGVAFPVDGGLTAS